MLKSKKMQKLIGLCVSVAVLASMMVASFTISSASSEEIYSLIDDATTDESVSWRDFGNGTRALIQI